MTDKEIDDIYGPTCYVLGNGNDIGMIKAREGAKFMRDHYEAKLKDGLENARKVKMFGHHTNGCGYRAHKPETCTCFMRTNSEFLANYQKDS